MQIVLFSLLFAASRAEAPRAGSAVTNAEREDVVELPKEIFILKEESRREMALTIADCVALTVADNFDALNARLNAKVAGVDVHRTLDQFIPRLAVGMNLGSNFLNGPSIRNELTSRDSTLGGQLQLIGGLPIGTSFSATLGLAERNSQLAADPFSYLGSASMRFEVSQSLLQRLGFGASAADFLTARANSRAADQRLQAAFEAIVQRVALTYYSLFEAREVLKVRREGRRLALELYEVTKKRIATGSAAPYEVYQAQSTLAARYSQELVAEQGQINAEETLLQLFNARVRGDEKVTADSYVVLPNAPAAIYENVPLNELIDKALKQRPDYLAIEDDQSAADAQSYAALRRLFPEVRIGAFFEAVPSAGRLGVAQARLVDSGVVPVDRRQLGDVGTAMSNLGTGAFSNYGMFLTLDVPLFFGQARFDYRATQAASERVRLTRYLTEQRVRTEVTLAVAQQNFAVKRIVMAKMQLNAAQQNLLAEMKKQKLGTSSNFDVLRIQDEVTNALFNLAVSTSEIGRAVTNLRFALGEGRQGMNFDIVSAQR